MPSDSERLAQYLQHLEARVRSRQQKLPPDLASFCASQPRECLGLVVRVLEQATSPELIRAVGDGLLQDLLNEKSGSIFEEVAQLLRTNRRFRQAFACGNLASVDPAVISDWLNVLQELGTTKQAERKSLWKK